MARMSVWPSVDSLSVLHPQPRWLRAGASDPPDVRWSGSLMRLPVSSWPPAPREGPTGGSRRKACPQKPRRWASATVPHWTHAVPSTSSFSPPSGVLSPQDVHPAESRCRPGPSQKAQKQGRAPRTHIVRRHGPRAARPSRTFTRVFPCLRGRCCRSWRGICDFRGP